MSPVWPENTDKFATSAAMILAAADQHRHIPLLTSEGKNGLDLVGAYRITAELRRLREARGERAVGRKIGFTNTTIWEQYNVAAPIWGYVYDTTLHSVADMVDPVSLDQFVEPRIEPEIVFGFARTPEPGMDELALLGCIEWIAAGFEVVQSLFQGWCFRAPDTIAAFGLHGALFVGEPVPLAHGTEREWQEALRRFEVQLCRDGIALETGYASNVLRGGPLSALRHLVALLAEDAGNPPLAAGEVVTTGTVTDAYSISAGETWTTRISGLPVPDISIAF